MTKHSFKEIITFGEALVKTQDLDPLYVGLVGADLPKDQLYRWLLCYFCFYNVGVASYMSELEGSAYWRRMLDAAANDSAPISRLPPVGERWPRAAERRHFRGQKCVDAVTWFSKRSPEFWVGLLTELGSLVTLKGVMAVVQEWPMCGPWIAFKAADLLERVVGVRIEFPEDITLLYKEPRAALDLLEGDPVQTNRKLIKHFGQYLAPPCYDRPCGVAETESILCKTKSSWGGHYYIGKDIHEQRHALKGWGVTADQILKFYPTEVTRKDDKRGLLF